MLSRHGPPRDRQHGRRTGRHHDRISRPTRRSAAFCERSSAKPTGRAIDGRCGRRLRCRGEIDLSALEPLIAMPSSPGNVVPVREIAGQGYLSGLYRLLGQPRLSRFCRRGRIVGTAKFHRTCSFDVNPTSRQILGNLIRDGHLVALVRARARAFIRPAATAASAWARRPPSGKTQLRTVPRNFPGRSGTEEDQVFLCRPETAAASALRGRITDPRSLDIPYPRLADPETVAVNTELLAPPPPAAEARAVELVKGPNIRSLPEFDPLPDNLALPVLLKMGDDVSTDEILPAGAKVLPYRSNIQKIEDFAFERIDFGLCRTRARGPRYDRTCGRRRPQLWPGLFARTCGGRAAGLGIADSCWQKGLPESIGRTSSIMACCRWCSSIPRTTTGCAQGDVLQRARSASRARDRQGDHARMRPGQLPPGMVSRKSRWIRSSRAD